MNCREVIEFLMDYVEGDLPADQLATFEAHMNACECCVRYMECYRKAVELGRKACADCEPVPEALIRAILAARQA